MSESKGDDSDDESSSSSSDSSSEDETNDNLTNKIAMPSHHEQGKAEVDDDDDELPLHQPSHIDNNINETREKSAVAKSAEGDDNSATSSSSSEEEEQQQQEEGYMFNNKLYATYQEMVAAKQERNRQVLERTTSEISLMIGSEYGNSSKTGSKKKKPSNKKLNKSSDGPPRRNPKRKARSPSSSSISTSSHHDDTPRKRSRSIGSSSRNSINSSDCGSISSSGKVPSDVFMNSNTFDNESIATQSTIDKNEKMLLQPHNRMVKDMCIQTEQILVTGKRIQERERMWQEFRRRNGGDRLDRSQIKQAREEEEEDDDDDDMSTHEDITSTVDWKLFHSSITVYSLAQDNGDNIGKKNRQDRTDVETVNPKFSSFIDNEDDIVIPEEYLATEGTDAHPNQQQVNDALSINNPVMYNNIIQEQNIHYTSKGIDRYWDEQYGDGIDPDLFVEKCCKDSDTDIPTADDVLDNSDNIGNTTSTAKGDSLYVDSLLRRCWDRAVHAASSTLTIPLSNEMEEGGVEGAVKTEEDNDTPPNQKDIGTALHQKARDAVDGILDTLLTKDSSLRLMLDDHKLNPRRVDLRDVLDCLWTAFEKQGTKEEEVLNQSFIKSLSIRLIERYGIANNG